MYLSVSSLSRSAYLLVSSLLFPRQNNLPCVIHVFLKEICPFSDCNYGCTVYVERSGSGVELRTLDYENPGSNPGCGVKTLGKFFHSTLLQFTQLFK